MYKIDVMYHFAFLVVFFVKDVQEPSSGHLVSLKTKQEKIKAKLDLLRPALWTWGSVLFFECVVVVENQ